MTDFELKSYHFDLPKELIAERPVPDRHSSRLMVYIEEKDQVIHTTFKQIGDYLPPDSTLVFNRSRVFPCRLICRKASGGMAEIFVLSLQALEGGHACFIRASGKRNVGEQFILEGGKARVVRISGDGTFVMAFDINSGDLNSLLKQSGKIPIPPYIRDGESDEKDKETYQTVFAQEEGSVAAPTAGLHFSQELLADLKNRGVGMATVTLHVGAGTFAPVKAENILEHKMHEEFYSIDETNLPLIQKASSRIAVGTTSLRTLESCWNGNGISFDPGQGMVPTSIFLHPGKPVHSIQGLVTNFHLPCSSLLMLVSAIIGREKVLELYALAVKERYRFFSYGDGMLILRK